MADFKVFEFDLIENKFVIGFDYMYTGRCYLNGTFRLSSQGCGITLLSLYKGVSQDEPIKLSALEASPKEMTAIKSNIHNHVRSVSKESVVKDINQFLNELLREI